MAMGEMGNEMENDDFNETRKESNSVKVFNGRNGKVELGDAKEFADKFKEEGDATMEFIMRGVSGENEGLYNGLDRNTKTYGGTLKARYYLIGASSGVGKTTFADWTFLIAPYLYYKYFGFTDRNGRTKKIKWIYFSFEISRLMKELSFITLFMNVIYGKELSLEQLTGENGVIEDYETLSQIAECRRMVNDMMSEVTFIESTMTAYEISSVVDEYAKETGTILNPDNPKKMRYARNKKNEGETTIILVDSINLVGREKGQSPKEAMDELSNLAVAQRNFYGFTYAIIQQFNNNLVGLTRQEFSGRGGTGNGAGLKPQKVDFGDTTYTYRDADYVIGGIMPSMYDIQTFLGYPIDINGQNALNKATFWFCIKDRWGGKNKITAVLRNTAAPILRELPLPSELGDMNQYRVPKQLQFSDRYGRVNNQS